MPDVEHWLQWEVAQKEKKREEKSKKERKKNCYHFIMIFPSGIILNLHLSKFNPTIIWIGTKH